MAVTEAVASEVVEVSVGETVEETVVETVEAMEVVEEDSEGATKWEEGWLKLLVSLHTYNFFYI